ncbi:zinc-dependent metalloprotease [soil metagenome]
MGDLMAGVVRGTLRGAGRRGGAGPRRGGTRAWQVGLAVGALAGIAGRYVGRRADLIARRGLVDWERAEQIAVSRLAHAPGALAASELRAAQPSYARAMDRVVPLLERSLGSPLPGVVERHEVVDRAGWARANLVTFRHLIGRIEEHLVVRRGTHEPGLAPGLTALANRIVSTQQVGLLLGFLGNRVLGQYDVALLSAEAPPGRLLFVEENIRATATALDVPLEDFRTWICLHETTHAYELEAHPWLRPYLAERIERQLSGFLGEVRTWRLESLVRAVRHSRRSGEPLLAGMLPDEQRRSLREMQAIMSVMEGFSDWVMDDVGGELLPDVPGMRKRFEARRDRRRRGIDRIVARLTGLDMKLEQYRRGERFVAGIVEVGGRTALARLWDGPASMPSDAELADPAAWVRRVCPETAVVGARSA